MDERAQSDASIDLDLSGAGRARRDLSGRALVLSVVLLLIALLAVVLLSKKFSLVVDAVAARIGAPPAFAPDLLPEHADLRYGQDQCPVRAGP